jgi:hypothetical protein
MHRLKAFSMHSQVAAYTKLNLASDYFLGYKMLPFQPLSATTEKGSITFIFIYFTISFGVCLNSTDFLTVFLDWVTKASKVKTVLFVHTPI